MSEKYQPTPEEIKKVEGSLAEVPEVVIDPSGAYKFIVSKLTDENGNSKLVIRADMSEYHDFIFSILKHEVKPRGLEVHCIGGGRININPKKKIITIWDKSTDYGKEPDRQQTVSMLQSAFPDYNIINQ